MCGYKLQMHYYNIKLVSMQNQKLQLFFMLYNVVRFIYSYSHFNNIDTYT